MLSLVKEYGYENEYEYIDEEYNIKKPKIENIMKKMGLSDEKVSQLELKTSNEMSIVFLHKDVKLAYQLFRYAKMWQNIQKLFVKINTSIEIDFDGSRLCYDLYDCIPKIEGVYDDIICWTKLIPLNSIDKELLPLFVEKNLLKIMWDTGKALNGLHQNCILHGDPTIDNIGILNGKFVLFDFDGSKMQEVKSFSSDFYKFRCSLRYNLGKNFSKYEYLISEYNILYFMIMQSELEAEKAIELFENLEIQYE